MEPIKVYDSNLRKPPMIEELRGLIHFKDLIAQLVSKGIKTRYKRSVIGVAWTMLQPLLTMTVLTIVFSGIFRFSSSEYALYVLSGLIVWSFFAQSTIASAGDLLWSGGLISKVLVPKSVFSISAVGIALINLLLALLVYFLIAAVVGRGIEPAVLLLPFPIAILGLGSLGVGLAVSAAAVYFPVEYAELEKFIDSPLRVYSSGVVAKLGFSVATQQYADVLLVDEGLAVGVLHFQHKWLARMQQFRERGATIILVTPALDITQSYCDRVAWIDGGKVMAIGPVEGVVDKFLNSQQHS